MNTLITHSFTAFVGIDWADRKHDVCIQAANSQQREFAVIPHKVELINEWAQSLVQRFGSPIAVAVELSKGPIVYALQKFDYFVIFPINPATLAKYRETFTPSGAKDDPTDAEFAVDLLLSHPNRFKPLQPQSVEMRTLSSLVEQRRSLVNDKIRITNRLRAALKNYYPQVLEWFDHIDTPLFCDFIMHWPTLTQAKRARKNTLKTFFHQHNMRFAQVLEERLTAIKTASPLTMDNAVIIPYRLQAQVLIEQLRVILKAIKQFDEEIERVAHTHADYSLFSSLPGAGPSLAPRLLVAFGEQRDRYQNAADLQKYAGVAPVTERSGKKHWVHWR
jgi:transposase